MRINVIKAISVACLLMLMIGNTWAQSEEKAAVEDSVQYYDLQPPFIANFGAASNKLKFVKADVSVRTSTAAAAALVKQHDPLIRHQIVMLLSSQTEEALSGPEGQETLRLEALKLVQKVLQDETGKPQIDDLLFTSFVLQR